MRLPPLIQRHRVIVGAGLALVLLAAVIIYKRQAAAKAQLAAAQAGGYPTGPYAATTPPLGSPAGDIVLAMPLPTAPPFGRGGTPPPDPADPPAFTDPGFTPQPIYSIPPGEGPGETPPPGSPPKEDPGPIYWIQPWPSDPVPLPQPIMTGAGLQSVSSTGGVIINPDMEDPYAHGVMLYPNSEQPYSKSGEGATTKTAGEPPDAVQQAIVGANIGAVKPTLLPE